MNTYIRQNKILVYALLFVIAFGIFCCIPDFSFAEASEILQVFDERNVLDDLLSSTVDGEPFDLDDFPARKDGQPRVLTLVEYGYSSISNLDYCLYLYIYNPSQIDFSMETDQNKVQMAVAFDSAGNAIRYEKFNLEYLSKSEKNGTEGLFYKFKIEDSSSFYFKVNANKRRYIISGVELVTKGNKNATEYRVGSEYSFTGYAKGYGEDPNAESTLKYVSTDTEVIELNVQQTTYRTNMSALGNGHYNSVQTAYFAVPEYYFETYGYLDKIRAEWWEFKTKMAFITSDLVLFNYVNKCQYVDCSQQTVPVVIEKINHTVYDSIPNPAGGVTPVLHTYYDFLYNSQALYQLTYSFRTATYSQNLLPLIFCATDVTDEQGVFDWLNSRTTSAGVVKASEVQSAIYGYNSQLDTGYVDCNNRKLSNDLFMDHVDEGRTMGYNDKTIQFDDTFKLESYDSNHTWFDKLLDFGFSWPETDGDKEVRPIENFDYNDLLSLDLSSKYLINPDDVESFREFAVQAQAENKRVVLFHYACTDYYSMEVDCSVYDLDDEGNIDVGTLFKPKKPKEYKGSSYVASQTVFFDFDIIELTFNQKGFETVIPVVSSPQDVIAGFEPPADRFDWWKILLIVLAFIVLVVIACVLFAYMPATMINIVKAPFAWGKKAVNKIEERNKEKRQKKKAKQESERVKKKHQASSNKKKMYKDCKKKQKILKKKLKDKHT